jgi:hypothetical protein
MVVTMKSFTIRGIDDKLYDEIKKHSANKSTSINKFILSLLKVNTGFEKEKDFTESYDDLDELFGKWSSEQYDLITKKINSERIIDKELWK